MLATRGGRGYDAAMRGMVVVVLVALVAFACGSVKEGSPEGSANPDGSVANGMDADAMPPDAAAFGPVDVSFRYYGTPMDAATILIYDAEGNFVREDTTDLNGQKRLEDFPRGGGVYVGKVYGNAPRAASAFGVVPGDNLVLGEPGYDVTTTPIKIASSTTGMVDHLDVGAGCNAIATPVTTFPFDLNAPNQCRVENAWTVVAIAYSSPTVPSQYAVMSNVTGANPLVLNGFTEAFNLSGFQVGVSNPLAGATAADVEFVFGWPMVGSRLQTFTNSGTASWQYPPGVQPKISYRVTSRIEFEAFSSFDRTIDPTLFENVNMGLLLLPHVDQVSGDFANTARPALSWSADPAIVAASDMILIHANWDGPGYYEWSIALPVDRTSFQIPEIPTEHVELIPPAGAGWFFSAFVTYMAAADASFDEMRQEPSKAYPGRATSRTFRLGPPI